MNTIINSLKRIRSIYSLFTRVDLVEAQRLAIKNNHNFDMVVVTAIIQFYLGGLGNIIVALMASLFVAGLWSLFTLEIVQFVLCFAVGFVLFIEYLYNRKGSSFLTKVEGMEKILCPEKNIDAKYDSINETVDEITKAHPVADKL